LNSTQQPKSKLVNGTGIGHALCVAMLSVAAQAFCAEQQVEQWGNTHSGEPVQRVTVQNLLGMKLAYIDLGATIVAIVVPDRRGKMQNVVLSLRDLQSYERTERRFGAVMGRYAGRIGNARFSLDGRAVDLIPGSHGTTLHGGPDGYDRRVWQRRDFSDANSLGSIFHLVSPAGDQNFPGRLDLNVTYRLLRRRNELRIEYAATTDAPTVLNLTNHSFFNLAGAGTAGLDSHRFQIDASWFALTDEKKVPLGTVASVAGTPLDFRKPAGLDERLASGSSLLGTPPGIDHSLLFTRWTGRLARVAVIDDTTSGRRMEVSTTEPSLQFNSGNSFDGSEVGSEGIGYRRYDGFAFETQHLPDSPNHPNFPGTALYPGANFRSMTSFRFSIINGRRTKTSGAMRRPAVDRK
jgi:aldose 1-epimerase